MSRAVYLAIDDDDDFRTVLARALARRGCEVHGADSIAAALDLARAHQPTHAVLDLRLAEESGLNLIEPLLELNPGLRIVVLTGYASIATAVHAIKLGAVQYLTKPAHVNDILAAFNMAAGDAATPLTPDPTPLDRAEWEHIQHALAACAGNVSAAAKRLGLHRRTLQRKLAKRPPQRMARD